MTERFNRPRSVRPKPFKRPAPLRPVESDEIDVEEYERIACRALVVKLPYEGVEEHLGPVRVGQADHRMG